MSLLVPVPFALVFDDKLMPTLLSSAPFRAEIYDLWRHNSVTVVTKPQKRSYEKSRKTL